MKMKQKKKPTARAKKHTHTVKLVKIIMFNGTRDSRNIDCVICLCHFK